MKTTRRKFLKGLGATLAGVLVAREITVKEAPQPIRGGKVPDFSGPKIHEPGGIRSDAKFNNEIWAKELQRNFEHSMEINDILAGNYTGTIKVG